MAKRGDRLVLGTRKGALGFERRRGGWKRWFAAHPGVPVAYAAADPRTGALWACLDHGHWGQKLSRSDDGGQTWREVAAPKYPKGAEIKKGQPATLKYLWVFQPGPADRPGRLYLGTEPGGLFRSDDDGASWKLVKGLWNQPSRLEQWFGGGRNTPGVHSVCIDPRDSAHVHVGISCAGVFETHDDGKTWAPRNKGLVAPFLPDPHAEIGHDPHFLTRSPTSPDVLWQQNHSGIFRSRDGAASWTMLSKSGVLPHFGFAIAVDERDADTAWVVPGEADERRMAVDGALCVCRTEDGGATWEALRGGLPQENAYDVALRHALDLAGKRLAFGTTTGNVYVSDDRGASWGALGNNLPPVYSVRFV